MACLTLLYILIRISKIIYQVKSAFRLQDWLLALTCCLSYPPGLNFKGENLCAFQMNYISQDNLILGSIIIIWYQDDVLYATMVSNPLLSI